MVDLEYGLRRFPRLVTPVPSLIELLGNSRERNELKGIDPDEDSLSTNRLPGRLGTPASGLALF